MDTGDEIDDGFEIPDILTDAGVTQMEMSMMNEGLKDHVVDVAAMVKSEYMERIQHLLPSRDGVRLPSQQVEEVLPVEFVLMRQHEEGLLDHPRYQLWKHEPQPRKHASRQVQVGY